VAKVTGRLIPAAGENRAKDEIPLSDSRVSLGRSGSNTVILDDREVSKNHAEIVPDGDGHLLRDLGSANGTFVNNKSVRLHRLVHGEIVQLGGCKYRYEAVGQTHASRVTILPQSPVDKTQVLMSSDMTTSRAGPEVRDLDRIRSLYERIHTAFEAVQKLLETTDIQVLCGRILDVVFELVRAETGAVLLFDANHQLVPWATRICRGETEQIVISRTIVDQVIRKKAAMLATDALSDGRWSNSESVVLSGVRSLMAVPLMKSERIYGLLHVGNSSETGAFGQADLELLTGIGTGAGVALSNAFLAHQLAEEARTRESLGRFLSPVLVEQVLARKIEMERGGEERDVTVMFADIRGFTSLTERSEARVIVELLNTYFDQMVEVVFKHHGTLDKFIGDAIMALWGTPVVSPDDAARAIAAGREMQETLVSLNAVRTERGEEPIAIGIGLASGRCVSGAMGARRRMEYTVIGDAVNLASRLAGIAKAGEILCDEETFTRARKPKESEKLPPAQVKGKTKPVPVYRLRAQAV
jgi:adenylate cyclase